MAKFYGMIGYAEPVERTPGVWLEDILEKPYYGELPRVFERVEGGSTVNSNINMANEVSIVADPFAREHFFAMRYVVYAGAKWKINSVEVQYPRLILKIGGLYNENKN